MRDFLEWDEEWDTGIQIIDSQHRSMGRELNRIAHLLNETGGATPHHDIVDKLLNRFLALTRDHFNKEEKEMRKLDYADYAEHRKEHSMLLAELALYIREIQRSRSHPDSSMLTNLKHWFIAHMVTADKAFAAHYRSID